MDGLFLTRLGFVALCVGGAVWLALRFDRAASALRTFFFEPTLPVNLGILRVLTFSSLIVDALQTRSELYAALPPGYLSLPQGWSWLGEHVPITPTCVAWAQRGLYVSAVLAMIGLFTRPAMVVAALLAVYVLGIPNFFFKIGHGSHLQVLVALALTVSPAGHGFSVDALLRRLRGRAPFAPDAAYTVPVRFGWLLVGTMYLFPGLWKLWEAGDLWITGVKLEVELRKKWGTMPEFFPPWRVDQYPSLLAVLGTATLLIEIGFFFALFWRPTRVIAALAAVGFHVGIGLNMNIWFNPLYPLAVLLEWPKLVSERVAQRAAAFTAWLGRRLPRWRPAAASTAAAPKLERSRGASFVVGSILVFAMFVAGFSPIDSWPIAVFPRFSARTAKPPKQAFALRYRIESPGGELRELRSPLGDLGDSVTYRITRELLQRSRRGRRDRSQHYLDLMAHLVRTSGEVIEPGSRLLVYRYDFRTDPDERRQVEPEQTLVAETEL
jgi:hypothetical protein